MQRIAILVGPKSSGSNMRALIDASRHAEANFEVGCVIAPVPDSPAARCAEALGVRTRVIAPTAGAGPYLDALAQDRIDWICLAGYLRLLPLAVLEHYHRRVINIHPALLPKFGGKGMYGLHVHKAVLSAGEQVSGCSVHYVSERYDEGDVIAQLRCPVLPDDTSETLAARVLNLEHKLYAATLSDLIRTHAANGPNP